MEILESNSWWIMAGILVIIELMSGTFQWIMLQAIEQYVAREEARESFKQEALASWVVYQETGRHLTGQEVRTRLNSWGTEDERAAPECYK